MLQALLAVEDSVLEQLARLHPRICPRQILGARIGQRAGELLDLA
jgi:formylmethanofuran dehydrogenase subunit E